MTNYVNIPENFEQKEKLSAVLDSMLNMLTLDSIFLSELQNEGENPYYFITAFVDANIEPIPNEVISLIAKIEKEYPDFKIRIYTEATSETALERGSLYFVEHCCLGFTLFANSEGEIIMDYQSLALNALLKRAIRYFNSEMQKIDAFIKAADKLIVEKQYGIAAFNLHQAFELTFRFIEQMCIGKSKITHSIISHIKYCDLFFPKLKPFSEVSKIDKSELLILLEHAYSVARYGDEYQISEAQVRNIRAEFNDFFKEVDAIYNKHLNHCKQQIIGTSNKDDETLNTEIVNDSPKKDTHKEPKDDDLIKAKINELINIKLCRLSPDSDKYYYKTNFMVHELSDILYDIAGIMKVCIIALEHADSRFNRLIPQPHVNIQTALEHILQLLPFEEMECLEEIIKDNGLPYEKE